MNRVEFYVAVIAVIIFFSWALYVLNYSSKVELRNTIYELDSLKTEVKVLKESIKCDTIIINLNLQKNGN